MTNIDGSSQEAWKEDERFEQMTQMAGHPDQLDAMRSLAEQLAREYLIPAGREQDDIRSEVSRLVESAQDQIDWNISIGQIPWPEGVMDPLFNNRTQEKTGLPRDRTGIGPTFEALYWSMARRANDLSMLSWAVAADTEPCPSVWILKNKPADDPLGQWFRENEELVRRLTGDLTSEDMRWALLWGIRAIQRGLTDQLTPEHTRAIGIELAYAASINQTPGFAGAIDLTASLDARQMRLYVPEDMMGRYVGQGKKNIIAMAHVIEHPVAVQRKVEDTVAAYLRLAVLRRDVRSVSDIVQRLVQEGKSEILVRIVRYHFGQREADFAWDRESQGEDALVEKFLGSSSRIEREKGEDPNRFAFETVCVPDLEAQVRENNDTRTNRQSPYVLDSNMVGQPIPIRRSDIQGSFARCDDLGIGITEITLRFDLIVERRLERGANIPEALAALAAGEIDGRLVYNRYSAVNVMDPELAAWERRKETERLAAEEQARVVIQEADKVHFDQHLESARTELVAHRLPLIGEEAEFTHEGITVKAEEGRAIVLAADPDKGVELQVKQKIEFRRGQIWKQEEFTSSIEQGWDHVVLAQGREPLYSSHKPDKEHKQLSVQFRVAVKAKHTNYLSPKGLTNEVWLDYEATASPPERVDEQVVQTIRAQTPKGEASVAIVLWRQGSRYEPEKMWGEHDLGLLLLDERARAALSRERTPDNLLGIQLDLLESLHAICRPDREAMPKDRDTAHVQYLLACSRHLIESRRACRKLTYAANRQFSHANAGRDPDDGYYSAAVYNRFEGLRGDFAGDQLTGFHYTALSLNFSEVASLLDLASQYEELGSHAVVIRKAVGSVQAQAESQTAETWKCAEEIQVSPALEVALGRMLLLYTHQQYEGLRDSVRQDPVYGRLFEGLFEVTDQIAAELGYERCEKAKRDFLAAEEEAKWQDEYEPVGDILADGEEREVEITITCRQSTGRFGNGSYYYEVTIAVPDVLVHCFQEYDDPWNKQPRRDLGEKSMTYDLTGRVRVGYAGRREAFGLDMGELTEGLQVDESRTVRRRVVGQKSTHWKRGDKWWLKWAADIERERLAEEEKAEAANRQNRESLRTMIEAGNIIFSGWEYTDTGNPTVMVRENGVWHIRELHLDTLGVGRRKGAGSLTTASSSTGTQIAQAMDRYGSFDWPISPSTRYPQGPIDIGRLAEDAAGGAEAEQQELTPEEENRRRLIDTQPVHRGIMLGAGYLNDAGADDVLVLMVTNPDYPDTWRVQVLHTDDWTISGGRSFNNSRAVSYLATEGEPPTDAQVSEFLAAYHGNSNFGAPAKGVPSKSERALVQAEPHWRGRTLADYARAQGGDGSTTSAREKALDFQPEEPVARFALKDVPRDQATQIASLDMIRSEVMPLLRQVARESEVLNAEEIYVALDLAYLFAQDDIQGMQERLARTSYRLELHAILFIRNPEYFTNEIQYDADSFSAAEGFWNRMLTHMLEIKTATEEQARLLAGAFHLLGRADQEMRHVDFAELYARQELENRVIDYIMEVNERYGGKLEQGIRDLGIPEPMQRANDVIREFELQLREKIQELEDGDLIQVWIQEWFENDRWIDILELG